MADAVLFIGVCNALRWPMHRTAFLDTLCDVFGDIGGQEKKSSGASPRCTADCLACHHDGTDSVVAFLANLYLHGDALFEFFHVTDDAHVSAGSRVQGA